ncbi:DUF4191 domain-containing protein [Georgenia sp. MJ206]|uniref:DUF4191 domain-containing protein n=1 Tax=Georgenia wangjunii TaxID=3117730 RepID=UPI002F2681CD
MARKKSEDTRADGAKAPKPKKQRWYRQLWDVYKMTRTAQPSITWWLLGVFVGVVALGVVVGLLLDQVLYMVLLSIPIAVIGVMLLLARRAEKAAYARIAGTPGATGSALGTIRRGWNLEEQPVAIDPRTQDLVFRAVGRPGVVLISEGPSHRAKRLLDTERRKVARVVPNVTIHLLQVGDDEGQIPLAKITKKVQKLKNTLTKAEVAEVSKRLRALSQTRMPIPKGVDPMRARPDRKGMRGR